MSVQLEVTRQDTYVLITLRGERPPSMEELGPRLRDALEQAVEWNLPVVLVREITGELRATRLDLLGWAHYLGTSKFRSKLALVAGGQIPADDLRLFANAAKGHGIRVRHFFSEDDAVTWVTES